jgi:hypothetical protein
MLFDEAGAKQCRLRHPRPRASQEFGSLMISLGALWEMDLWGV